MIDHSERAYTVFAGLPRQQADGVKAKIAGETAQLVSFEEFADRRTFFIAGRIVSDEYVGSRAVDGIVELVRKYPGIPFGITWNGGIAYTRMDYEFAKRQFGIYSKDPEEYRRARNSNRAGDPVNPESHLRPLLGW